MQKTLGLLFIEKLEDYHGCSCSDRSCTVMQARILPPVNVQGKRRAKCFTYILIATEKFEKKNKKVPRSREARLDLPIHALKIHVVHCIEGPFFCFCKIRETHETGRVM